MSEKVKLFVESESGFHNQDMNLEILFVRKDFSELVPHYTERHQQVNFYSLYSTTVNSQL